MGVFPFTIVTRRREPTTGRDYSGGFFRGIVPMTFEPQASPPPVPYGDYYAVGRDPYHVGRTHDVTVDLPLAERLAVVGWPFYAVERDAGVDRTMTASGHMNPLPQRVDIEPRGSMAFADLTTLDLKRMPLTGLAPDLLKLT